MLNVAKNKRFFTVIQIAKILGITRSAVYKKINNGQINIESINGRILVPAETIETMATGQLTDKIKAEIDKGVAQVVKEYGETLRMLGKE